MAKYMVFYNTTSAMRAQMAEIPPDQAAAGMEGWMTWGAQVGDRLVDMGSPLVNDGDDDVQVSGYSIIDADSQEHLDGLLEGHPHTAAGRNHLDAEVHGDAGHVTRGPMAVPGPTPPWGRILRRVHVAGGRRRPPRRGTGLGDCSARADGAGPDRSLRGLPRHQCR